ncbi:ectoine/hydroxyectoine ABC transporter permease subunit EhuD [Mesorhizobium caraganae]|uniref:ectoine/hydroxyectoine ABC transporter permease subunit EhuD n=1 Tax=Mesorhizobium caraganae TaxID=483206 RepID=UPI00177F7DD0|nr:ectoine/hydroxyectoine ABC transporter permease subunit EhuD [Mesorhizobium caraganae]MBM2712929.1 ectoine/hydroxyectoine ABC transporter permease subunit EhuD [Mesorhizobium caraganae]
MNFDLTYLLQIAPLLLKGAVVTVQATVLGTLLAAVLGLLMAILTRSRLRIVRYATTAVVLFVRNTPLLIQLFFLFYILPQFGIALPTYLTGVIALGIHYAAYMSEVYRAGITAVPRGQWEAAHALNMPRALVWRRIILPQALPPIIPPLGNYAIAMFKDTPVLATIGILEMLGVALAEANRSYRYYEPLTMVGILFLIFSLFSAVAVRLLEKRYAAR